MHRLLAYGRPGTNQSGCTKKVILVHQTHLFTPCERRLRQIGVCGVEVVGQCEGNNREDEVGVLCEGGVSGGSSNVRSMTCARDDECVGDNAHKEHCNVSLSHAREKIARVNSFEVRSTVYNSRRSEGNRHFLWAKRLVKMNSMVVLPP